MSNVLDELSKFYIEEQLDFDKRLIRYRYKSIKKYFNGNIALEMGPAEGVMTQWLVNDFSQIDLLDGSQKLLDIIPHYSNIKKICSLFENFVPTQKYDTIIMEHILEHIEDPTSVLKRVKVWLSKGGRIIIGVPNAKSFHRLAAVKMGLLNSEYSLNSRDHALGHKRVYDLKTLKEHVISSGLNIIYSGGVFLKPLSNGQIEKNWTPQMMDGFYELGKQFPNNTAEIYVIAEL